MRRTGHSAAPVWLVVLAIAATIVLTARACADDAPTQSTRVLPADERPDDARLAPPVSLRTGYFPFVPPETRQEWTRRSTAQRTQLLVAAGLWPSPPRPEPRAVVHGAVDRGAYVVEKVFLESYPGHLVTGNLYRPVDSLADGEKHAAVLSPYGHWPGGRFGDWGAENVAQQIAEGAERYPRGGRHPLQARCVQLARMGAVVLIIDAVGYGDSQQISAEVAHAITEPRPEHETADDYGFFNTQAELRLQSIYGLQGYNALCALDWLASRPDVDPQRIGVVGGSGGATQTMFVCGVDDRPAAAFEAVMVSTAMQGGCPCENACCLRTREGNVGIAALMAPKPLGMTSANDWTVELHEKGYPQLQQLYHLLGAPQNVHLAKLTQFRHNFNYPSRAALYEWFNTHLQLGAESPVVEQDFEPLTVEEMSVWDDDHPAPAGGFEHERAVLAAMTEQSQAELAKLRPHDAESLARYREVIGAAFDAILGPAPAAEDCSLEILEETTDRVGRTIARVQVHDSGRQAVLPAITVRPREFQGHWIVLADGAGKSALFDETGELQETVAQLLDFGFGVLGVDALGQGELTHEGAAPGENWLVDSDRRLASFTYGYNLTLVAQRAGDLVAAAHALRAEANDPVRVGLRAQPGATSYAAAATALAPAAFDNTAIDANGFCFADLESWHDDDFLPGVVKYGDLAGLLSLYAPRPLAVTGVGRDDLALAAAAYAAAGKAQELVVIERDELENRGGLPIQPYQP